MENPIKMDDLGYHYFWKHPYMWQWKLHWQPQSSDKKMSEPWESTTLGVIFTPYFEGLKPFHFSNGFFGVHRLHGHIREVSWAVRVPFRNPMNPNKRKRWGGRCGSLPEAHKIWRLHPGKLTAGTWKTPIWRGKSSSKSSLLGSMWIFGGVFHPPHLPHLSKENNRSMRYMSKLQDRSKKIPTDPWKIPEVKVPQNANMKGGFRIIKRWKSWELVLCSAGMLEFSLYQVLPSDPFGCFKWPFQGLSDLHLGYLSL